MTRERKKYSKEFKMETIRMYENDERSASEIERELGISNGLLEKWRLELNRRPKKEESFPGNGRLTDTEAHIRQLEREIVHLKQDKDILKKAPPAVARRHFLFTNYESRVTIHYPCITGLNLCPYIRY